MFNGHSKQDERGADGDAHGNADDIVDIREDQAEGSLPEMVRSSLGASQPRFPSRLLWDRRGLKLFEDITFSEEYYLTNAEMGILDKYAGEVAHKIAPRTVMVELGSGNLRKIRILLQALDKLGRDVDYYALDLSASELQRSLQQLPPGTFKHVRCHGLLGTYDDGRRWLQRPENLRRPKCILSLGSTIGSFARPDAAEFLAGFAGSLHCSASSIDAEHAADSAILVGLDACYVGEKVYRAYNDAQGRNRDFILNALDRANTVLGYAAFQKSGWGVQGEWNAASGSHDQYLIPRQDVVFNDRRFERGSRILVVQSFKYNPKQQAQLWEAAGLAEKACWSNDDGFYGIHLLSASQPLPN